MQRKGYEVYKRAARRVRHIKRFYGYLCIFLVANGVLWLLKGRIRSLFLEKGAADPRLLDWLDVNMALIPVLWGLGLVFYGLYVFRFQAKPLNRGGLRFGAVDNWEKGQLRKYLDNEI